MRKYKYLHCINYLVASLRMPYLRFTEACVLIAQPVHVHVADDEDVQHIPVVNVMVFCGNADWTRELMSFVTYDNDICSLMV